MFNDQLAGAIAEARTLARLDALSEALWKAWGAGGIGDDDAQAAAALLAARRSVVRGDIKPVGIPPGRSSIFPPRRAHVPPDRPAALLRRRQLAASGPMPPALAAKFTTAELAALRIVGDEVRERVLRAVSRRDRRQGGVRAHERPERHPRGCPARADHGAGAAPAR